MKTKLIEQICLRDQLIDKLVNEVEIWKHCAAVEANMSEVLRKELAKVIEQCDQLREDVLYQMSKRCEG